MISKEEIDASFQYCSCEILRVRCSRQWSNDGRPSFRELIYPITLIYRVFHYEPIKPHTSTITFFFHHPIHLLYRVGDPIVFACFDQISHDFQTQHHILPLVIFVLFSLIIAYSTLSLFHLKWWFFTRHFMEDCHILSLRSPHGQWFRDLNLRNCLVSEDSCYIRMWRGFYHLGMYFHGRSFIID